MMKRLLVLWLLTLAACNVDKDVAESVLGDEGYYDVELTGHAWFDCGEDDERATHFRAKRRYVLEDGTTAEREVEGTICCGLIMKDCTVRH